jgi:hypothetical protein
MQPDTQSSDVARELDGCLRRYPGLCHEIRTDLDELRATGLMSRAQQLSQAVGQPFAANDYPHFFFGDLDARFVVVHLNPLYTPNPRALFQGDPEPCSFEEHFERHRYFGARNYGPTSPRTHRSRFDHKQIAFVREFDVLEFGPDKFTNLERVIDDKLQLELIPYGSPSFSPAGFTAQLLAPHFERVMRVITAAPRDYVIFCGAVFSKLLRDDWITQEHHFRLTKGDGTPEKPTSRFCSLRIPWNGEVVRAGLAQSWARQGIPMGAYAREVRARY